MQKINHPNILHIFVDQMRFDTIAALGNKYIITPNLDRLVREGVAFTNAYTPSPVCISARCSMIYGQYPMNTGCYENTNMPQDGRQSFMDGLKNSGYYTYGIGKCHFEPDADALLGFTVREKQEELGAFSLDKEPYLKLLKENGYDHVMEPHGVRGEMYYVPQPSQLPEALHPTNWIGDRSTQFIHKQKETHQPWYLFSSFIHPHPPFAPPNPWHKLYRSPLMALPMVPTDSDSLLTYVNKCQNRYKYKDQGSDNNLARTIKAYYYACISFIDFQVGKLLKALEETNQLNNTLIVFTGDHGEHLGDYHCYGKRSFHDTAAKVPMVLRMPGKFEGGKICDTPVSLIDLAPTFLNSAGGTIKSHELDGIDLHQILTGESKRDIVYGQLAYAGSNDIVAAAVQKPNAYDNAPDLLRASSSTYMAVTKDWKYFYSAPDEREFLFDKVHDEKETRDAAGIVFNQGPLTAMRRQTMDFLKKGSETAGIKNDQWVCFGKKELPRNPDTGLLIQDTKIPWVKTEIEGYSNRSLERMF